MSEEIPHIDDYGPDAPRTKAEWDAKYGGAARLTGKFNFKDSFAPMRFAVLVAELELLDGKIVGATGADGVRYGVTRRVRGDNVVYGLICDGQNLPNWPYPEGLE